MAMLERYDPFAGAMSRWPTTPWERWFDRFFDEALGLDATRGTAWCPAVDIYEDGEKVVYRFDVPEVRREELAVRIEDGVLTVEGKRDLEFEKTRENYHRIERCWGSFARSFSLPETVSRDEVEAELKEGVLRLTLMKKPEARTRPIRIKE
jgi:HSP20 family protein